MKPKLLFAAMAMFLAAGIICPVFGFEQEDMMLHGFASQGYLRSSHNNYLGNSEDGSFEFNEIGVNFMIPVTDSLRFGIQFFSMDLGDFGNNDLIVDWALLDYNFNQYIGIRVGKFKGPVGLRNRSRDVDNLRTPIILNQTVYLEGFREMIVAVYGFNPYGSASLGMFGELNYDVFTGIVELSKANPFVTDIFDRLSYTDQFFASLGDLDTSNTEITVKHSEGALIVWETPLSGLSIGLTAITGRFDAEIDPVLIESELKKYHIYSLKYDIKNFTIISEWMEFKMKFDLQIPLIGNIPVERSLEGWYTEICWKALRNVFLALSYGEYYPDSDDKSGHKLDDVPEKTLPDYYAWQKDTTVSIRYNINEYMCVKFETHFIDGLGLTEVADYEAGNMKRHWNLYACKVSLNF